MKKMIIALVAMFAMTMSVNAQSIDDKSTISLERVSSYLDLTSDQIEPFKTAIAQFNVSMESSYLKNPSTSSEAWEKIKTRHMNTMKQILSDKQYEKYVKQFELTAKNTIIRMTQESTAAK